MHAIDKKNVFLARRIFVPQPVVLRQMVARKYCTLTMPFRGCLFGQTRGLTSCGCSLPFYFYTCHQFPRIVPAACHQFPKMVPSWKIRLMFLLITNHTTPIASYAFFNIPFGCCKTCMKQTTLYNSGYYTIGLRRSGAQGTRGHSTIDKKNVFLARRTFVPQAVVLRQMVARKYAPLPCNSCRV